MFGDWVMSYFLGTTVMFHSIKKVIPVLEGCGCSPRYDPMKALIEQSVILMRPSGPLGEKSAERNNLSMNSIFGKISVNMRCRDNLKMRDPQSFLKTFEARIEL